MKRGPFSNQTIVGPNPRKPHIVKRFGYWRVSPLPKIRTVEQRILWELAHRWAMEQNYIAQLQANEQYYLSKGKEFDEP